MENMKETLGLIGSILALLGYLLYLRGVLQRTIRPHAFSWLVWSTLTGLLVIRRTHE